MQYLVLLLGIIGTDSVPTLSVSPDQPAPSAAAQPAQDNGMPPMNMPGMNSSDMNKSSMGGMSGMNMFGMNMSGMGGMRMGIGDMAMGTMGFMKVMNSRAEPGLLMKLLCGQDAPISGMDSMNGMGSMDGMKMDGMSSMSGMNKDHMGSMKDTASGRANLAAEDRKLVDAQEWCPITKMRLGSMGAPIKITLKDQAVFLCCNECVDKARADPDKTLAEVAKLKERKAQNPADTSDKDSMGGMAMNGKGSMNGMAGMEGMSGMNGMEGMNRRRFSLSGWTDMSFTASTANSTNLPMGFNYLANEFLLQQNWLRIDYAVDEKSCSPSFGFRSDWILPGSDYLFTLPRGIFNEQLHANEGRPERYGIDPIEFYGEAYFPGVADGLDVKVGRFCMLHGVEMNEATMNLLASHSYTFIADPFTHTGILTTTKLSKQWVVQAGITTGSDMFFDAGETPTFVGGVKWFSADERTTVGLMTVFGSAKYDPAAGFDNKNIFDLTIHQKLGEKLYYTLEGLYGYELDVPMTGTARWYGAVQYLTYELCPKLAPTTRLEFFDDVNGWRTGFAGLYTAITAGAYYQPTNWLTLRPELRYDYSNGRAFEGEHNLFTATADVIIRW